MATERFPVACEGADAVPLDPKDWSGGWEQIDLPKFRACPQARGHYIQKQEWQIIRGVDGARGRHLQDFGLLSAPQGLHHLDGLVSPAG